MRPENVKMDDKDVPGQPVKAGSIPDFKPNNPVLSDQEFEDRKAGI